MPYCLKSNTLNIVFSIQFLKYLKIICYWFLEGERKKQYKPLMSESNIDWLPPIGAHSLGVCPDLPLSVQGMMLTDTPARAANKLSTRRGVALVYYSHCLLWSIRCRALRLYSVYG